MYNNHIRGAVGEKRLVINKFKDSDIRQRYDWGTTQKPTKLSKAEFIPE